MTRPGEPTARVRQRGCPDSTQPVPRKQRSLGSERGLATPSPDEKGEMTLGPSMKIMPLDPYSRLGRSCEPAYQVDLLARELPGDVTRWLTAGLRPEAMRRAARSPGREAHQRSSPLGPGPDRVTGGRGRRVRARPETPNSDIHRCLRRWFSQLDLLERTRRQRPRPRRDLLSALCAFIAVEEPGEVSASPASIPMTTPRLPPARFLASSRRSLRPAVRERPRVPAAHAGVSLQIPGASRRAEHVRPILDHASCDPPLRADRPRQRAFRDVPGGRFPCRAAPSVRHSATGADPPFH